MLELGLLDGGLPAYGDDVKQLRVNVTYGGAHGLRVAIYDPARERWQVPQSLIPRDQGVERPPRHARGPAAGADYAFSYTSSPFGFAVVRPSTGEVLFNSTPPADSRFNGLVFKDQYLEMSTALPDSAALFGLGESTQPAGLALNASHGKPYTLWAHDTPALAANTNLCAKAAPPAADCPILPLTPPPAPPRRLLALLRGPAPGQRQRARRLPPQLQRDGRVLQRQLPHLPRHRRHSRLLLPHGALPGGGALRAPPSPARLLAAHRESLPPLRLSPSHRWCPSRLRWWAGPTCRPTGVWVSTTAAGATPASTRWPQWSPTTATRAFRWCVQRQPLPLLPPPFSV